MTITEQPGADLPLQQQERVVIRFAGDSGDGMQVTGTQFTNTSAIVGHDLATLPDFPAEIRAPAGTRPGVSGFQIHFSSADVHTPGDGPDVLVAMNPAALVVNIGDLMAEWTNDRWVSTVHRVVNPPREKADDSRRISLVFFHQPNYDAMVECLPTVLEPGETPKYAPVSSGQHLFDKFMKQTGMTAS